MDITQHPLYGVGRLSLAVRLDLDPLDGRALVRVQAKDSTTNALLALRQRDYVGWVTPSKWSAPLAALISETVEDLTEPFPDV